MNVDKWMEVKGALLVSKRNDPRFVHFSFKSIKTELHLFYILFKLFNYKTKITFLFKKIYN